jgi:hypothetical protein
MGEGLLQAPAEKRESGERGSTLSSAAGCTRRAGDGAGHAGDEAASGAGDLKDRGGEVWEGGGPSGRGLAMPVPGAMPDLGGEAVAACGGGPLLCAASPGEGSARLNGHQAGVSGRAPLGAVCGAPTARDHSVAVEGRRELPPPGRAEAGTARERGAEDRHGCGEPFAGLGRGRAQGVGGAWLRRAEQVAQGRRDRNGEAAGRSGEVFWQRVLAPERSGMRRTRGTGAVTAGMVDTVL